MSDEIEVEGLEELIVRFGVDLEPALGAAAVAIAAEAQDRIAPYPGASRKPQPFRSAKQRRGFFARLRSGAIQVPYRRGSSPGSQTLGRRWNIQPQRLGATLQNTASYAGLVHGKAEQAKYHKGTWKTDEDVKESIERDGTAERVIEQAMKQALDIE